MAAAGDCQIQGTFVAYGHEVTLSVGDFEFNTMAFFASDDGIRRNVLGRFGWLDRVVLGLVITTESFTSHLTQSNATLNPNIILRGSVTGFVSSVSDTSRFDE